MSCDDNNLTNLDINTNSALKTLYCSNNKLTSLDISNNPSLKVLWCLNNNLKTLVFNNNPSFNSLWCSNNNLSFSQLPDPTNSPSYYNYSDQLLNIGVQNNNKYYLSPNIPIDLSSEKNIHGTESTIIWKNKGGEEISPSTNNNWLFTFDESFLGQTIYCELNNTLFPDLAPLKSVEVTIVENTDLAFPNREYSIDENLDINSSIGILSAYDLESDPLIYTIKSGNINETFALNSETGELSINDPTAIDYETIALFPLVVSVTDGTNTSDATVNIKVKDINESPAFNNQNFSIAENTVKNTIIGYLSADDPEGAALTFSIDNGNSNKALALNSSTGELSVNNPTMLDYEVITEFVLQVSVTDGRYTSSSTITLELTDVYDEKIGLNPSIGVARDGAVSFTINNILYIGLGRNNKQIFQDFYKYSPQTDKWTIVSNFPGQARTNAEAFVINGKAYVGLGRGENYSTLFRDFYEFDPTTESWKQVADFGGTARYSAVNFAIGNYGYVGTGKDVTGAQKDFWKYNPTTDQWTQVSDINGDKRSGAFAFVINNKAYVGGGYYYDSYSMQLSDIREYDPENNSWKEKIYTDGINLSFNDATTFVTNNKAYIAYGSKNKVVSYNPATNKVENLGDILNIGNNRHDAISFVLNKEAYFGLGRTSDFFNTTYHQDILATGFKVNEVPIFVNQSFSVAENSTSQTIIGTLSVKDPESDPLTYEIVSGNENNVIALNSKTGELSISDASAFDYEANQSFTLEAKVSDGLNTSTANITIDIKDINDAPIFNNQNFTISENPNQHAFIGRLSATDQENHSITFHPESGNFHNEVFAINYTKGEIYVKNPSYFDYETNQSFKLKIKATDGQLYSSATITINIADVNEAPELTDKSFFIKENSVNETIVGNLTVSDPESEVLTYKIESGNNNNAFIINATGEITVNDETVLDYETNKTHTLVINASDGTNTTKANIYITLEDVNEPPVVETANFSIEENSTNGTVVGTINASDPESDPLNFQLGEGNINDAFSIDANGQLTVNNVSVLDFETTPVFNIKLNVSDGTLSTASTIEVKLTDEVETTSISSLATQKIKLYPIPARNTINLDFESNNINYTQYCIIDLNGKQLLYGKITQLQNAIDVSSLTKGMYFIQLQGKKQLETIRFSVK